MAKEIVKYHGIESESRAVKMVWVDDQLVFVCIAEMNERGHSRGLPTLKIASPDDRKAMDLAYSSRSFAPEMTAEEFNSIARRVSDSILAFASELPLKDGLSQTNLITV